MKPEEFINQVEDARITAAIAEAEKKSTGEIRVYISHKERHDALAFAKKRFQQLGMTRTKQRNAVLLYIVPRTQQFAVLGDTGIHQKGGDEFWKSIAAGMAQQMKAGRFTEAIVGAIREISAVLEKHFPSTGENRNELSNEIARD
jgi:uncharacterized membrane protein